MKENRPRTSVPKSDNSSKLFKAFRFKGLKYISFQRLKQIFAVFLLLFGIFLLIAFISHTFFAKAADQSLSQQGPLGSYGDELPQNAGGAIGAWLAYRFITAGYGVIMILFPFYVILAGYAILEHKIRPIFNKLTIYTVFFSFWVSSFFALITQVFDLQVADLGGGVGAQIITWLSYFIGKTGAAFLLILVLLIFLAARMKTFTIIDNIKQSLEKTFFFILTKKESTAKFDKSTFAHTPNTSSQSIKSTDLQEDEEFAFSVRQVQYETIDNHPDSQLREEALQAAIQKPDFNATTPNALKNEPNPDFSPFPVKKSVPQPREIEFSINPTISEPEVLNEGFFNPPVQNTLPISENLVIPLQSDNLIEVDEDVFVRNITEQDQELSSDEISFEEWSPFDPTRELSRYQFPTLDLLKQYETPGERQVDKDELDKNKNRIVTTLHNFGIEIVQIKATIGPTVTLYEIVPAPGVKVSKIRGLEDDIALSLAAKGIRIIAPMPGKGTIGIEIPNAKPEIVSFRSLVATEKYINSTAQLPLALGKTIANEVYIADLAKMPHLLVAGATGQGKSVGLNCIIASLLYKKHPSQLKFVLIDPKKLELTLYETLEKHFLAKLPNIEEAIITDTKQVINVLNSLVVEMETRYEILKKARVRNIIEYNEKFMARKLNPKEGHHFLPYIVLIIDELADLMMTAGKEIETPIARLAQLARAAGLHLVLATQRPSVNVITGIIKANFPARMAYFVRTSVDSRTILDCNGAERLIGNGDLLLLIGSELIRLQNAFIDTDEVKRIVDSIAVQPGYPEPFWLPEVESDADNVDQDNLMPGDWDPLFADAARLIYATGQGSTSIIQRRLKLGYNRSARIMEQLEKAGIVGPSAGSKPRQLLVHDATELEKIITYFV